MNALSIFLERQKIKKEVWATYFKKWDEQIEVSDCGDVTILKTEELVKIHKKGATFTVRKTWPKKCYRRRISSKYKKHHRRNVSDVDNSFNDTETDKSLQKQEDQTYKQNSLSQSLQWLKYVVVDSDDSDLEDEVMLHKLEDHKNENNASSSCVKAQDVVQAAKKLCKNADLDTEVSLSKVDGLQGSIESKYKQEELSYGLKDLHVFIQRISLPVVENTKINSDKPVQNEDHKCEDSSASSCSEGLITASQSWKKTNLNLVCNSDISHVKTEKLLEGEACGNKKNTKPLQLRKHKSIGRHKKRYNTDVHADIPSPNPEKVEKLMDPQEYKYPANITTNVLQCQRSPAHVRQKPWNYVIVESDVSDLEE